MENELLNLSDEINCNLEKVSVLLDFVLDKENINPEIYVPLGFVKETIQKIGDVNSDMCEKATKSLLQI